MRLASLGYFFPLIYSLVSIGQGYSEPCREEVNVNISDIIFGLIDDVPSEIINSYIKASSMCMHDVKKSNVKMLNTGSNICNRETSCKMCGTIMETNNNCKSCCGVCRCVGCSWNRGPGTNWFGHERLCDSCCVQQEEICESYLYDCFGCNMANEGEKSCKSCCNQCRCEGCHIDDERNGWQKYIYGDYVCDDCCSSRRHLSMQEMSETYVYYGLSVCMDAVSPLDKTEVYYRDYKEMLNDFVNDLHYCYENKTQFITTWATLSAAQGLDLSLMTRDESRDTTTILFGYTGMEVSEAEVKTYYSSDSHKATSHMIFYGAIGFIIISMSAIFATYVIVRKINEKKEEKAKLLANIGKSYEI